MKWQPQEPQAPQCGGIIKVSLLILLKIYHENETECKCEFGIVYVYSMIFNEKKSNGKKHFKTWIEKKEIKISL